jgi:hypothetical protein
MAERKGEPMGEAGDGGDRVPGLVGELLKRAVASGMGALFFTEEGIRNVVGELKLPKEMLAFLLAQADRTRAEVARVATAEVRRFLEGEKLRRELWRLLTGVTLEIHATVQIKPGGEPSFKAELKKREPREQEERTSADGSGSSPGSASGPGASSNPGAAAADRSPSPFAPASAFDPPREPPR